MSNLKDIADAMEAARERADRSSKQLEDVANGPIGVEVETDSGPVPTLQEFLFRNQQKIDEARPENIIADDAPPAPNKVYSSQALADDSDPSRGAGMVGYMADMIGAVGRTQGQKNLEAVSVKDFGARGGGVTDDTPAFMRALASGAKYIHIPGTANEVYLISNLQISSSGVAFIGDGYPTLRAMDRADSAPLILSLQSAQDVSFSGVVFDGNTEFVTNFNNVTQVYQSHRTSFLFCKFVNCRGIAALNSGGGYATYYRCEFDNCGMYHTVSGNPADRKQAIAFTGLCVSPSVDDCRFDSVGLDCVSFAATASDIRLTRCRATNTHAGTYYISNVDGGVIAENIVSNGLSGGNGIDIVNAKNLTVVGNRAFGCGAAGLLIAGNCENISISGNLCYNNWKSGTSVHRGGITFHLVSGTAMSGISLTGNTCFDNQGAGNVTQRYAVGVVLSGGTASRICIDQSNDFTGYNSAGSPSVTDVFQSTGLGLVGYPYTFNLADQAEVTLYTAAGFYAEFDVIQASNNFYGKFYGRPAQPPQKIIDAGNHFEVTDTGTTTAIYRDADTNTVRLRNRTGATRQYVVLPVSTLRG